MRWRELAPEARLYILYHTLLSPTLFTWILLPYYLLSSGYNILETGLLFTGIRIASLPLTLLLGRIFTIRDIRSGLLIIHVTEAFSYGLYYLATGTLLPFIILLGGILERTAGVFYFLYPAYERLVYPEERMREALAWHLRLPELAVVLSYPLIGFYLSYECASSACIRASFLAFSVYSFLLVPLLFKFKRAVPVEESEEEESVGGSLWNRFKFYIIIEILFIIAWSLAPGLALVYIILDRYNGNLFYIALAEASISLASITATFFSDKVETRYAFKMLQVGTLLTIAGLLLLALGDTLPFLVIAAYTARLGDSLVFVYKRVWLYGIMGRREASLISSYLSFLNKLITLLSPLVVGALGYIDARLPYISCIAILTITIPIYSIVERREFRKTLYSK